MSYKLLGIAIAIIAVTFVFAFPAFAQETGTVVDFTNPLTAIITAIGSAIGIVAMFFYNKVSAKWGLNKIISDKEVKNMLDKVLDEAVDYGAGKIAKADWTKIETKNEVLAMAARYAIDHGGDLATKLGVDQDTLLEKLEARLIKHDTAPGVWEDTPDA